MERKETSGDPRRRQDEDRQGVDEVEDPELEVRPVQTVDVLLAHEAGRGECGGERGPDVLCEVSREDAGVDGEVYDDDQYDEEGGVLAVEQDDEDDRGKPEDDEEEVVEEAAQGG